MRVWEGIIIQFEWVSKGISAFQSIVRNFSFSIESSTYGTVSGDPLPEQVSLRRSFQFSSRSVIVCLLWVTHSLFHPREHTDHWTGI